MGRIFLPANFCDYFLISPTTAPEGKKQFLLLQAKSEGKKYWPMKFCEPTTTAVWQRKKKDLDCILSCADQAARTTFGDRQKGGKEGGREKPSYKFATVIQIQALDKHIHPIMLRLFVTIGTFFLLFIQQLGNLRQFKLNLRVFLFLKSFSEDLHFILKLLFRSGTKFMFTKQISSAMEIVFA